MDEWVLLSGRILNGLLAGIYLAFAVAVMPALRAMPDDVFSRVMNQINVAIVNPVFVVIFLGAPVAAVALLGWDRSPLAWAAAACAVLALVITVVGNVPLNDALADGGSRSDFETPWLVLHAVRTAAATGGLVLLTLVGRT